MDVKIEVAGLEELQKKLEQVAKTASEFIIPRAALLVERQAKLNATGGGHHTGGGPNVRTGRLRASIAIELGPKPYTWARVGTNVKYAPFVEFGHSQKVGRFVPVNGGFRLKNSRAPAYPFLEPAIEQVRTSGGLNGVFADFIHKAEADFGK